jgi:hypothetical protein
VSGRLAALSVIATLALAGMALAGTAAACPMEQSASNDQTVVTASAPSQAPATGTPATGTTTPKTPEAEIGG